MTPPSPNTGRPIVDVTIGWGSSVLAVRRVDLHRGFIIGEEGSGVDFVVPCAHLGWTRMPLVLAGHGGARVVLPKGAEGTVGQTALGFGEAAASGLAVPCDEVPGCLAIALSTTSHVRVELGTVSFQIATSRESHLAPLHARDSIDLGVAFAIALSACMHIGLMAALFVTIPILEPGDSPFDDQQSWLMVSQYLSVRAEPGTVPELTEGSDGQAPTENSADGNCGGSPRKAGALVAEKAGRYGVQGPRNNPDPHIASATGPAEVDEDPSIGTHSHSNSKAPSAPWGRIDALGTDPINARGSMWGDDIADIAGLGGSASRGECESCGDGDAAGFKASDREFVGTSVRTHRSPVTARFPRRGWSRPSVSTPGRPTCFRPRRAESPLAGKWR